VRDDALLGAIETRGLLAPPAPHPLSPPAGAGLGRGGGGGGLGGGGGAGGGGQQLQPQHHGVGKSGEGMGQVQAVVLDARVAGAHSEKYWCSHCVLIVFSLCSHIRMRAWQAHILKSTLYTAFR
jgi:hypothetical protein